jgi:membrane protease YdiL (CAAX protease family)
MDELIETGVEAGSGINGKAPARGKVTVTGANVVIFIFAVAFIVHQVVLTEWLGGDFFTDNFYYTLIFNEIALILLPTLIYVIAVKANLRETFRINKISPAAVVLIILASVPAYFAASMLNNIVYYFLQFVGRIPYQSIPAPKGIKEYVAAVVVMALLPGICEEIMHRGLILKAYENRGSIKAIFISALFFGFFHFDITNFAGPVLLGILIGFYVVRTNSIFSGIIAHCANNIIATTLVYLWEDSNVELEEYVSISAGELGHVILLGVGGLIVLVFWLLSSLK